MNYSLDNAGVQFNLELTKFAFEAMASENDVSKAITRVLKRVGQFYHLSHITVLEKKSNLQCFTVTYEWCHEGEKSLLNHITTYSSEFKNYFFQEKDFHEVLMLSDIAKYDTECEIIHMLHQHKENEVFCCGLRHKKSYFGIISYESEEPEREFSENEISCFMQTKQILEDYFITMRKYKDAKERLQQVQMYDPVTGLIKYELFLEQAETIYRSDDSNQRYVIMYADIVNFKYFNEYYGYTQGDQALRLFEQCFMSENKYHLIGCRIFSDYFISLVTCDDSMSDRKIQQVIAANQKRYTKEIEKNCTDAKIQIAVGIVYVKDHTLGIKHYIDCANQARKMAKQTATVCMIYNEEMELEGKRRLWITNHAEEAVKNGEFYFVLQPKVDLATRQLVGAEALVRWKDKEDHCLYPNEFIPIFEENGFITKLDFYIYTKVFEYIKKRLDAGLKVVPVSLNVSRVHLTRANFIKKISKLIAQYEIPAEYVEFELTESVFLQNAQEAQRTMLELKNCGFKVSMDDFGSGYSSLNLLTSLDFDILKLDKEFLNEDKVSKKDEVVIQSIIRMAKLMNMVVLCEGVETKEQAKMLRKLNCDLVQGYFFGKPMEINRFDSLLIQED